MRQEFLNRLQEILREKSRGSWKDGWVYGRLKQEFVLQQDELEEMARRLGFKRGWNTQLESLLEEQWQREKHAEETLDRVRQDEANRRLAAIEIQKITHALHSDLNIDKDFSDIEMALFLLISRMDVCEQQNLLIKLAKRHKLDSNCSLEH
ncbi:MAG TPA: hypothetical protein V6D19_09140 [Stenomitos sp.]